MIKRAILLLQILIAATTIASAKRADEPIQEADSVERYKYITIVDEIYVGNFWNRFRERRVDREINKKKFIFAGEKMVGITASHYSLSGENADYLLLLTDITANGSITSIKPYVGYLYRDNRAVGLRFNYSNIEGKIDNTTLDLGETNGISFDVPYISLASKSYSLSLYHRSYAALDDAGRYGVFADIELTASRGKSIFEYDNGDEIKTTESRSNSIGVSFNPGICAFVMHNLSASLSFQLGGIDLKRIDQYDVAGEWVGSRTSSQMQFMFNVLAVNLGITFHIW